MSNRRLRCCSKRSQAPRSSKISHYPEPSSMIRHGVVPSRAIRRHPAPSRSAELSLASGWFDCWWEELSWGLGTPEQDPSLRGRGTRAGHHKGRTQGVQRGAPTTSLNGFFSGGASERGPGATCVGQRAFPQHEAVSVTQPWQA